MTKKKTEMSTIPKQKSIAIRQFQMHFYFVPQIFQRFLHFDLWHFWKYIYLPIFNDTNHTNLLKLLDQYLITIRKRKKKLNRWPVILQNQNIFAAVWVFSTYIHKTWSNASYKLQLPNHVSLYFCCWWFQKNERPLREVIINANQM